MKSLAPLFLGLTIGLATLLPASARAESHRATRLGNPATRFAPPLYTPDDLRARFRDPRLQPDFAAVLKQWGWQGDINDMFAAAATAEIADIKIPIGEVMPFMSSREGGRAICLRNVTWAGKEPAPAYAFFFTSKGLRYRCVTPKACSNFFLEDLGPEPKPALTINCAAPAEVPVGRPLGICLTVQNTGNAVEPKVTVTLPVPPGVFVARTTEGGTLNGGVLTWEIPNLDANATKQVCATLGMRQLGPLPFAATASGTSASSVETACETKIIGIPAILLEAIDVEDPIEVGKEAVYEIKVTNQGSATGTNIRVVCTLAASQEFVSATGSTPAHAEGGTITMETLPALAAQAAASWRVVVKALQAEDVRFKVRLTSDQFEQPITEDESTQQY